LRFEKDVFNLKLYFDLMTNKIQIGMLASILLVAGILTGMTIAPIAAQKVVGAMVIDLEKTNRIEIVDVVDPEAPTIKLDKITKLRHSTNKLDPITHTIHYRVTAGLTNLHNIELEVKSDVEQEDYSIGVLAAFKNSRNVARIKALDVDSITIEVTGYSMSSPTSHPRG